MFKDFFKLALENLSHRRVRSWLTILGIVIGIAAVVALVSLGQGLQYTVDQQFVKIGADKITIAPKTAIQGPPGAEESVIKLTTDDLKVVRKSAGVEQAVGVLQKYTRVEFNNKLRATFVIGLPVDESRVVYEDAGLYDTESGRGLKQGDKGKIIIGPELAKAANFGKEIQIGDKITVENKSFTVVGIIKKGGNPGVSSSVVMTIDDARALYNEPDLVSAITAKARDATLVDQTVENIKKDLRRHRDVKEGKEDFTVQSTKKYVESFLSIFNVVTTLLVGLASISIIVGAVGIANTMYTAVLERTREIGIMKAIGAKNSDILTIFIIESGLIGLIGGAIGVAIGVGLSKIAELLIAGFLGEGFFQVFFPWYLVVGSLLFAFVIGALSGILPARQASKMNPVDALRG